MICELAAHIAKVAALEAIAKREATKAFNRLVVRVAVLGLLVVKGSGTGVAARGSMVPAMRDAGQSALMQEAQTAAHESRFRTCLCRWVYWKLAGWCNQSS